MTALNRKRIVIAIDGPAAAGKSTTARGVARRLGYLYVDTGAMYRAMALKLLRDGVDLKDPEAVNECAQNTEVRLIQKNGDLRVLLDGKDVTEEIRKPEISRAASIVSINEGVRKKLVEEQRRLGLEGGIVLEGRDIGTVVFPDADLKIYMVADVEARARRRQRELEAKGVTAELATLVNEIVERDGRDESRAVSPLRKADDAIVLDTSQLSIEAQIEFIIERAKSIIERE